MGDTLLEMVNIKKDFGATKALDGVSFRVDAGEVHMLLGENGAGKSTLMKILAGSLEADSGEIISKGKEVQIKTPSDAHKIGIGMVYQELANVSEMSVLENVLLGNMPKKQGTFFIDWKEAARKTVDILKRVGLADINLKTKLLDLSLGTKQLIEIAKALTRNAKILILDEPTSALTETEVEKLFKIIVNLQNQGVAFVYITHKLDEVFKIGNKVTVFRDGKKVGETRDIKEVNEEQMVHDMVGRAITNYYPKEKNVIKDDYILTVKDLFDNKHFHNVSFGVKRGEVLGIAGLDGSGRTEMLEAIYGLRKYTSGEIKYNGSKLERTTPEHSLKVGVGLLTRERKGGLLLHMPIYRTITISNFTEYTKFKILRLKNKEIETAKRYKVELMIASRTVLELAGDLSGGNQQKVIISKLLCSNCKLFLMDDPTRGVDVGAKVEIYKILNRLTKAGCGVVLVSSEMPELINMSDRVLVMREGVICGEFASEECSQEMIMKKIAGVQEEKVI